MTKDEEQEAMKNTIDWSKPVECEGLGRALVAWTASAFQRTEERRAGNATSDDEKHMEKDPTGCAGTFDHGIKITDAIDPELAQNIRKETERAKIRLERIMFQTVDVLDPSNYACVRRRSNAPISPEKPTEAAENLKKEVRGFDLIGFPHVRIDDGGCAENTTGTQKIPPETPKLEGYLWAYKSKTGVFQAIKCGYGAALDREELDPGDVRIDLSKIIIPPEAIEIIAPPAPKKRVKGWLNLYPGNGTSILYNTRGMADQEATNSRTTRSACIEIDFEKGEGL